MSNQCAVVTIDDMDRLAHLVRNLRHSPFKDQQQIELLDKVLENADALASDRFPRDVIRMNSRFCVLDLDNGESLRYTLSYPENADLSKGHISILAPVGTAVLGRRRGEIVNARVPGGSRRLKIKHVLHRPARRTNQTRPGQPSRPKADLRVVLRSIRLAA